MSEHGSGFYQAGLRCDAAGCSASIWRVGPSRESAQTIVQFDAKTLGWQLVPDRSVAGRDLCPEHAKAAEQWDGIVAWSGGPP